MAKEPKTPTPFNPGFGPMGFFTALGSQVGAEAARQARKTSNPNARPVGNRSARKAQRRKELQQQQAQMGPLYEALGMMLQPATARRKTIGGQFERPEDVRDLAWLERNGPDRESVARRQQRLQAQGLSRPGVMEQAKADVELAKKNQEAWQTLFPKAPTQNQDEYLRTATPGVDVVFDPKYNQVNPRTGLVTNTGPFQRQMETPYGKGSASFLGEPQPMVRQPRPQQTTALPQVPQATPVSAQDLGFLSFLQGLSQPISEEQPQVNPAGAFSAPTTSWQDVFNAASNFVPAYSGAPTK